MMRKRTAFLTATVMSAATMAVSAAFADPQQITLDTKFLYVTRDKPDDIAFSFRDGSEGTPDVDDFIALSTDDLDFDFEPGVAVTLSKNHSATTRWELSGFWLAEHESSGVTSRDGISDSGIEPFEPAWETDDTDFCVSFTCGSDGDFTDAYLHTVDLESQIWGLEANFVRDFAPLANSGLQPSLMIGLRYLRFDEELEFRSFDELNDFEGLDDDVGLYDIDTDNNLIGVQAGLATRWDIGNNVKLDFFGKGGVFANFADQESRFSNGLPVSDPFTASGSEDRTDLAFVLEAGAGFDIGITDRVSFGFDYSLLHISGVALAPDQFIRGQTFDSFELINSDGSVLYHGLRAGFTVAFGPVPERPTAAIASGDVASSTADASVNGAFLFMTRSLPDDIVFSVIDGGSTPGGTDEVALSTEHLDLDFEPGFEVAANIAASPTSYYQLKGFWLAEHADSAATVPFEFDEPFETAWETDDTDFDLLPDGDDNDFTDAYQHIVDFESQIWGLEANFVQNLATVGPIRPSVLMGLRYISFEEELGFTSIDEESDPVEEYGQYDIETENRMIGAQIGIKTAWDVASNGTLSFSGKGGLYANFAEQDSSFANPDGSVPPDFSVSGGDDDPGLAHVLEAGANLSFAVTDQVTIGLGYKALYLSGVALAPEQFIRGQSVDALNGLDKDGSVLYHGGRVGIRVSF